VASDLRRLKEMDWEDRVLLVEAAGALTAASLAIRLLPFRWLANRLADGGLGGGKHSPAAHREIERVRWAIEACGRRLPWRIVCFQKGLALHRLLQRRGIPTTLHYGVAQNVERGLTAHVWVTFEGNPIIGGEEAIGYTCLATFPAIGQR
jgi:hypothetical protein